MLYGIESHGIIPTTINSVDTRTIDVGAVSKNGQNLELPPGGNFYREAAASAADRTVWALVYLCTRLELSLFFIRDRFLDEWLPTISSAGVTTGGILGLYDLFIQGLNDGCHIRGTSERLQKLCRCYYTRSA